MTGLFQYTLAISLPLVILWALYRVALASGRRFAVNRRILLGIYAVSYYLFPALRLCGAAGAPAPVGERTLVISAAGGWLLDHIATLAGIWAIGACAMLIFTLYECFRIYMVLRRCRKTEVAGSKVWISPDRNLAPFSFGRYIVLNETDFSRHSDIILAHELAHVSHHHIRDMLVAQLTVILCWYNPAAWLLRSELKMIHEYQADKAVISSGYDATAYQKFLVRSVASSLLPSIGNKIHYGAMKRRILMMNAGSGHNSRSIWRYALPLAGVIAAAFILDRPVAREVLASVGAESLQTHNVDVFIDGEEMPWEDLNSVPSGQIKSITVNKAHNRIDIYTK